MGSALQLSLSVTSLATCIVVVLGTLVGFVLARRQFRGKELVDAYHAMDVFAFASQSETQGLVVTEAMAAGIPVVAVDAPGVREVVKDGVNGRLIINENIEDFVASLEWLKKQSIPGIKKIKNFLYRFRGMKVSTGKIRKTVVGEGLPLARPKKKRRKSSTKLLN